MIDEIRQQPEVLRRILREPPGSLDMLRRRFSGRHPPLIVIAARGTSDHAAIFGKYLFEITLGIPTSLAAPSVGTLYRGRPVPESAVVIGISQSGESTDINAFLDVARACGSFTIGITNERSGTMAGLVDEILPTRAGKEKSVAATKTYTAQLLTLYLLAKAMGARISSDDLMRLPESAERQLECEAGIGQLARHYRGMSRAVVVGRGYNFANSLEFALKMMETSYVVATGFSCADFAHGPIAIVEEAFPAFIFSPPGPTYQETSKLLARLTDRHVDTICIGAPPEVRAQSPSHRIEIAGELPWVQDHAEDMLTPIPMIVPAQLFAAHLAASKGLDPDKPRMLSKVTHTL